MARTVGATAAKTKAMFEWVIDKIENNPVIPDSILKAELMRDFELKRARAYEVIKKARDWLDEQSEPNQSWELNQKSHLRKLKAMEAELQQTVYSASLENNHLAKLRALQVWERVALQILNFSPEETFKSQSEHLAALKAAKEAHSLDEPIPWN
jgi:hypothetical protein